MLPEEPRPPKRENTDLPGAALRPSRVAVAAGAGYITLANALATAAMLRLFSAATQMRPESSP